jgi:predicted nucleotidyltransferase
LRPSESPSRLRQRTLAEIVQTLTIDHGCHAIILYGSRAGGNFPPTSDWDVASIREAGETAPLRVARAFHGAWLDAFVYAEAAFAMVDPELLRFCPRASWSTSAASPRCS